jgi:hypothetical protein
MPWFMRKQLKARGPQMARKTISTANITLSLIDRAVVYLVTIFQLTRIFTNDGRHGASVEHNETLSSG